MKVTKSEKYNNKTIEPETGMVLSDWNKQDILNYSSYRRMTAPMAFDENKLYEIPIEEDEKYRSEQKEAYEKEEAKRR